MRAITSCWLLCVGLVGCAGEPPPLLGFGEPCDVDDDCASSMCHATDGFCTDACSAAEPCAARFVCGASSLCDLACTDGSVQGSGATRELCVDGVFAACSTRDAVADCDVCGCEPFGGGTCVAGRGCVVPQPDGATCTADVDCTSGACLRDTSVCGQPRAMGEACTVDAECETRNCSTDGDPTVAGVCNQELGSECTGFGPTPTCTNCFRWDSILPSVCARAHCGPEAACAQLGDSRRVWSCEMSTDGMHRCYEQCDSDGSYNCFDSGAFCRANGFCG